MTDKTREKIAEGNPYPEHEEGWFGGARHEEIEHYALRKGFEQGAAFVLATQEIKEGQELLEKAKSGKLVELDDDQSWPEHGLERNCGIGLSHLGDRQVHDRMLGLGFDRAIGEARRAGFRRVKVKG